MPAHIGVTCSADDQGRAIVRTPYYRAVHRAGALPVALPFLDDLDVARSLMDRLDGLVLTGSEDLDPALWGQPLHPAVTLMHPARQRTELLLGQAWLERDLPVLAICGGMQNLAVAAGGTIHQHLPELGDHVLDHARSADGPRHAVEATPGSCLAGLLGTSFEANSVHHQGIDRLGAGMTAVAHAPDGVVEAWEMPERRFAVGVQWHPERMPDDERQAGLFRALVAAAG